LAPAFFTAIAVLTVCSSDSTEQGPAITTNSPPIFTPLTSMTLRLKSALPAASFKFFIDFSLQRLAGLDGRLVIFLPIVGPII
jgi:hypothetical protein